MAVVVPKPTDMDLDPPATSQLGFRVLSPQLEQAGSVNPPPHRRRLANNHPRINLSHCPLLCPCASLNLHPSLPQRLHPAAVTVTTAAARHMLNIPLPGRSKMKAQDVAEGQGTPHCYTRLFY